MAPRNSTTERTTDADTAAQNGTPAQPDAAAQIVAEEAELAALEAQLQAARDRKTARVDAERKAQLAAAMAEADSLIKAVADARESGELAVFATATRELADKAREIAKANAVKVSGSGTRGTGAQTNPTDDKLDVWVTRAWDAMRADGTFAGDAKATPSQFQTRINELVQAAGFAGGYKPSTGAIGNNLEERSKKDGSQVEMFSNPLRFAPTATE